MIHRPRPASARVLFQERGKLLQRVVLAPGFRAVDEHGAMTVGDDELRNEIREEPVHDLYLGLALLGRSAPAEPGFLGGALHRK